MKFFKNILLPMAFWLAVWQLAALIVGKQLLLPGPWAVAVRLGALAVTAGFWRAAALTLLRVFAGMAIGAVLGVLLAVLTCVSVWCDRLLSPLVKVIRATPVASFILLVLLWVSSGRVPAVISALMVLPVIWGSVSKGIRETDPQLLELARAYRFGAWRTLRLVRVPCVLPYFTSAAETALGLAWKAGVAAEVLCYPKWAVGSEIYRARLSFETADLFAWTAVVIALSFLVESALARLLRKAAGHD